MSFQDAIFCSTCIKNQQLLTAALANYLPPSEDPLYDRYEASLPEYQRNLEDRYPQVCGQCEPSVRERLHGAYNHAKSDHIRRMLDQTRARRMIANRLGLGSLVVSMGAIGYFASIAGQLLWHAACATANPSHELEPIGFLDCIQQCASEGQVAISCIYTTSRLTGLALLLGLLSIWWNPRWQHKLQGRDGRLCGLKDYYRAQMLLLAIRFGLWVWLQDPSTCGIPANMQRAVHSVSLVFEILAVVSSLFIVKFDTTPVVSWHEPSAPLLSKAQYRAPDISRGQFAPLLTSQNGVQKPHAFSIGSLASEATPKYSEWQVPTPPEEDTDAMDWEPSTNFLPLPKQPHFKAPAQPSPFYGSLPSMPTNRPLHPKPQTQLQPREALGIPAGFFDRKAMKDINESSQLSVRPSFAQPKFFADTDRKTDTGLEGIFGKVFSMKEEPPEVQSLVPQSQSSGKGIFEVPLHSTKPKSRSSTRMIHAANVLLLAVGLVLWTFMTFSNLHTPNLSLSIIAVITISSFQPLLWRLRRPRHQRFNGIILLCLEAFAGVALALHIWLNGYEIRGKSNLCVFGLLCRLLLQAVYDVMNDGFVDFPMPQKELVPPARPLIGEQQMVAFSEQPDSALLTETPTKWDSYTSQASSFVPRTRAGSTGSTASTISTAPSETTSGWKTPKRQGMGTSQSPGFSLGGLALNDRGSPERRNPMLQTYGNTGLSRRKMAF